MDNQEIASSIHLSLRKDLDDLKQGIIPLKVYVKGGKRTIEYKYSDTLIEIFLGIQNDINLKKLFVRILKEKISGTADEIIYNSRWMINISNCAICFYTLTRLGYTDDAITALDKRSSCYDSAFLLFLLSEMAKADHNYFTIKQIHELTNTVNLLNIIGMAYTAEDMIYNKDTCLRLLIARGYNQVEDRLKGINHEINKDKEEVKKLIHYREFGEKYNILLDRLDDFINTDDPVVSAAMIGNLRSFMEELLKDLAKKIASIEKEDIPKNKDRNGMGNVRAYLETKLELSKNEDAFIDKYVDILHAQGGHSFVSDKRYFRLARNIGIEVALLVLSIYNDKYPKDS